MKKPLLLFSFILSAALALFTPVAAADTIVTKKARELSLTASPAGNWLLVISDPDGLAEPQAVTVGSLKLSLFPSQSGNAGKYLSTDGNNLSWVSPASGTVSSVALNLPNDLFTITGSPVTGSGTLTGTAANQNANTVWAGPTTGAAAPPAFRALTSADLPTTLVLNTGSYADPSWITAVAGSKLTGAYTSSSLSISTAARLLGRSSAGSGAAQEIPLGTGLSMPSGTLILATPLQTIATGSGALDLSGLTLTLPSSVTLNSAAQTLTNKTIDGASNTITIRLANDVSGVLGVPNGGTGQASLPKWSLYTDNAPSSLAANTLSKAEYTQVRFDTAGLYDSTNKRIVVDRTGTWQVACNLRVAHPVSNATYQAFLFVNGSRTRDFASSYADANGSSHSTGAAIIQLNSGDYVEIYWFGNFVSSSPDTTMESGAYPFSCSFDGSFIP